MIAVFLIGVCTVQYFLRVLTVRYRFIIALRFVEAIVSNDSKELLRESSTLARQTRLMVPTQRFKQNEGISPEIRGRLKAFMLS